MLFSAQRLVSSLYSINVLAFIPEAACFYCALLLIFSSLNVKTNFQLMTVKVHIYIILYFNISCIYSYRFRFI